MMNPEDYTILRFLREDSEKSLEILAELVDQACSPLDWTINSVKHVTDKLNELYQEYQEALADVCRDYQTSGGDERVLFGSQI